MWPRRPLGRLLRRLGDRLDPSGAPACPYQTRDALATLWAAVRTLDSRPDPPATHEPLPNARSRQIRSKP